MKGSRVTTERIQQFWTVVHLRLEGDVWVEREIFTDVGAFTEYKN